MLYYNKRMTDTTIKYFLEIVDQGINFTKASQALYVAQTALTKHINALNKELEVKLFDTADKRHISLTPAGKLYYQFFSECRNKFKKVYAEAKALASSEAGELRIACLAGWDMMALLPGKKKFQNAYPNISFILSTGNFKNLKNGLLNNQYDLVVTLSDQFYGVPNISIHDHFSVPCILLFSSHHPLADKENLQITDFKDDRFCVITDEETPLPRLHNEAYCKSKGFIPQFEIFHSFESILLALQTGAGYTILDEWIWVKNNPNFKYIPLDASLTISEVWKTDNTNRALRLFLETIVLST